jgi:hypothetical protein
LYIDAIHHKRSSWFLKFFSVFSWRVEGFGLRKGMEMDDRFHIARLVRIFSLLFGLMPRPTWRSDGAEGATPIVGRGSSCLEGLPELLWPDFNSEDLERFGKKKKKKLNFKRVSLSSEERRKHVHGSLHGERERERVSRFYLTSHVLYVFQNHVF